MRYLPSTAFFLSFVVWSNLVSRSILSRNKTPSGVCTADRLSPCLAISIPLFGIATTRLLLVQRSRQRPPCVGSACTCEYRPITMLFAHPFTRRANVPSTSAHAIPLTKSWKPPLQMWFPAGREPIYVAATTFPYPVSSSSSRRGDILATSSATNYPRCASGLLRTR